MGCTFSSLQTAHESCFVHERKPGGKGTRHLNFPEVSMRSVSSNSATPHVIFGHEKMWTACWKADTELCVAEAVMVCGVCVVRDCK